MSDIQDLMKKWRKDRQREYGRKVIASVKRNQDLSGLNQSFSKSLSVNKSPDMAKHRAEYVQRLSTIPTIKLNPARRNVDLTPIRINRVGENLGTDSDGDGIIDIIDPAPNNPNIPFMRIDAISPTRNIGGISSNVGVPSYRDINIYSPSRNIGGIGHINIGPSFRGK